MDTHTSGNFVNPFKFHLLHQNHLSPFRQYCFFKNLYRPTFEFVQTIVRKVEDHLIWRTEIKTPLDLDHGFASYGSRTLSARPWQRSPPASTRPVARQVSPATPRPPPATPQPAPPPLSSITSFPTPATLPWLASTRTATRRAHCRRQMSTPPCRPPPPEPSPASPCQRRPPGVR
jgi:hypothetical protein